jgi:coenzyme F420-0:L-glutamate ligase / coenzyme F420-1:gamma-L-glutamate ligase
LIALSATALQGIPEVRPGDDVAALIVSALREPDGAGDPPNAGDVVVLAHKIVSKAEGRVRALVDVEPGSRALRLAREHGKDPRHVQVVLDESRELLRASHGVLICVTPQGFVCANAGVDASNAPEPGTVVLLPSDPDHSARRIRAGLQSRLGVAPAVVITDSFGRAWRRGQCDVAIGCAGIGPLDDWRGRTDAMRRELTATTIAVADEIAAAADLARTKDGSQPVVLVRGAGRHVTEDDGPGAAMILRPEVEDLFR